MPEVSAIKPQKRKKDRVNIFLDGVFAFSLKAEVALGKGLKPGVNLSQEEVEKLVKEDEYGKVLDKTLKFISFRPRSEKEISDYFVKNQIGEFVKKAVFKQLNKYGYINDSAFADWWIKQRQDFRPKGKRIIFGELLKKGINKSLILEKLSEIGDESEEEACLQIAEKKKQSLLKFPTREARIKLSQYLLRRGYDWDTVKIVVDKVLGKD